MSARTISSPTHTLSRVLMVVALALTACLSVIAETAPEFGVAPLSAPDGVMLIVGGPLLHPSSAASSGGWIGYHIYRKMSGDTGFVRITSAPLSRPGTLADLEKAMGGSIDGFERFAGFHTKQEFWQAIQRNDSAIVAISFLSKNFRHALGMLLLDTKVERGKSYSYSATMVSATGTESPRSEQQTVVFGTPLIPLIGPLDVMAESKDPGVFLTWRPNPDDSGAFSYSVYRCPDSVGTFLKLNLAALTPSIDSANVTGDVTFTDTTARAGRTYYYAVVSTDYAGNESPRTHLIALAPADNARPPIPQNLFANPSDLGITLTWDTVAGTDIVGYNLYRSVDADSNYVIVNTLPLPADTGYFEDHSTNLVDRYFYRVTAIGRNGLESEKSARALSLFENHTQLVPPQSVIAKPTANGITVTWEKSSESDVRGYYVFRADSYNGFLSQVSPLVGRDTTTFTDTSKYLSSNSQYWYLVQSINYAGVSSSYSAPALAYPDKPESVDAPRSFFGYQDDRKIRLYWTRLDDNAVSGYRVYRADGTDSLNWKPLTAAFLPREISEFTDTTAASGQFYSYQLRALNNEGIEGPASHSLHIEAFAPAALPPGGLRANQQGNALILAWTPTSQPSVAGYRIYRRTDTEPSAVLSPQPLPTTTTTYHDTTVRLGTRYYYSISSVEQSGREGNRSIEVSFLCK
jgi:fibronectin type 3 domain-containing protein